jgi:hypothetical protein
MNFHMLVVFLMSVGLFVTAGRFLQYIVHFGWFTRQAGLYWPGILIFCPLFAYWGYLSAIELPPLKWATSAVLGAVLGMLLLRLAKRPPSLKAS